MRSQPLNLVSIQVKDVNEAVACAGDIVFSILILILVFRPEGLLGEQTPEGA